MVWRRLTRVGELGNLVLQDTVERIFAEGLYADAKRGVHLIRGENVLLMGEIVRSFPFLAPQLPRGEAFAWINY